ncbi:hypothetical protein B9G98_01385 [Wickerhamiella sorbophila]|uniref:Importin N-terminal domain-containing protein n=1 Tax=Wickerhamiella sorbophila TaxID=45607 RepID=A0A2T0FFK4_9ASCO|nr:hypothetical protein B9G98_01385 [Wickerhamiella sorbophila]PRT53765.1 hypothetical protein B9G98_01385 [Wickerhamiella sorbophila]
MTGQGLILALTNATSQTDETQRKQGEAELKSLSNSSGFLSQLLEAYQDSSLPVTVRWMAVIYLKNSIDNCWRKSANSNLLPEEKNFIRERLLPLSCQPFEPMLHRQLAVVVAKVAKLDFPRTWPTLFDELREAIISTASKNDSSSLYNILLTTHQVVKTLASVRIGPARAKILEIAPDFLQVTGDMFMHLMQNMSDDNLAIAYSALKATCTLIYDGHDRMHRFDTARSFFGKTLDMLVQLHSMWQSSHAEILGKLVRRIGKLYIRLLQKRPLSFCMMPRSMEIADFYEQFLISKGQEQLKASMNDDLSDEVEFYDLLAIQGMIVTRELLHVVTRDPHTATPALLPISMRPRDEQDRQDLINSYDIVSRDAFGREKLDKLVYSLISAWFQLRPADLELWKDDPEDYIIRDSQASVDFKVSSCAQALFYQLIKAFPQLAQDVLRYVEHVLQKDGTELPDVLELDGALQCLEYGAGTLVNHTALEPILEQALVPRLNAVSVDSYRIIRRRICLMIAAWVPIRSDENFRHFIYEMVSKQIFSSNPLNDLIVQLAGLHLLKVSVDDFDANVDEFMPYAEQNFEKIYELIGKVSTLEIKRLLLENLSVFVGALGTKLSAQYIEAILQILPPLWHEKTEDQLLKTVILQTLSSLVDATRDKSPVCYPLAQECLSVSIDPKSPFISYLLEDALALWRSIVVNATEPHPMILGLFPNLVDLLEVSTEHVGEELLILESYLKLEPSILSDSNIMLRIFNLSALYLPQASVEVALSLLSSIEVVVSSGVPVEAYGEQLAQSGLIPLLVDIALAGIIEGNVVAGIRAAKVYMVFAWLAFSSPSFFTHLLTEDQLMKITDGWLNIVASVAEPGDRKMNALGVSSLIYVTPILFLQNSQRFINMWTSILDEVREENGDAAAYHQVDSYPGEGDGDLTPETLRQRARRAQTPIHTVPTRNFLSQLTEKLRQDPQGVQVLANWQP